MLVPTIQTGKKKKHKTSPGEQKNTTDKLDPFMRPFNKVHLHSYLTTLFENKDEQLPHAKHSLHLHV